MGALFTVYESDQYIVHNSRGQYPSERPDYHHNAYYDNYGPGGCRNHSMDSIISYYNCSEIQQHLMRRERMLSENFIERDKVYNAEIRKRDECYAKHKRRLKKRFSLYSLLYR